MAAIITKRKRETVDYQQLHNFSSVMFYGTTRKRGKVYKKTFTVERIIYRQKLQNVSVRRNAGNSGQLISFFALKITQSQVVKPYCYCL